MTTDEFAWLIVRAVGAFVLLLVALDVIAIVLTSIQLAIMYTEIMSDISKDGGVSSSVRYGVLIGRNWSLGIGVVFKAVLANYCFFHGVWIHRLLTSRLPSAEKP